ncbi:PREDICTED: uncharacterized protein C14orf142 homolog [Miniopterus natalensis]|uniref:uncharacterized protein C14orf142 homolog n=1 Tax=Miniopterus natalensis TaxID=291302 RepID=UPI0007A6C6EE|nr:PREDICTED: uncharacterized protein C14orf142 homolog [Miniopterus natalensis]
MEISGEYIALGGQPRQLRVPCEALGNADPFQGLLSGVARMRELVAELLDPQVQREAQDGAAAAPDEALNGDDEDDEEDENNIDNRTNSDGPSAKRPKPPC